MEKINALDKLENIDLELQGLGIVVNMAGECFIEFEDRQALSYLLYKVTQRLREDISMIDNVFRKKDER